MELIQEMRQSINSKRVNRVQSSETRRCDTQKSSGLMNKLNNTLKQIRDSSEGRRSEILSQASEHTASF